ncbi:MAG TPA: DUF2189 domain-containing protein [Beijerinckiaceae bacterium]|nr:DUF2189 domain-containing protein [Beijerinckiaceae bacterium]
MDGQDLLAQTQTQSESSARPDPVVRTIQFSDIADALAAGMRDFRAAPFYGLTFGALYALGGILIVATVAALNMPYFTYPLAIGFVLIGPLVAIGLYEISRLLERGEKITWGSIFSAIWTQAGKEIGWMCFVVLFITTMWLYQVRLLLALFLRNETMTSMGEFFTVVSTTSQGWMFLGVGHVIGAILSTVMFSLTVVSFPILLDRTIDFITAMITSVRAVVNNPKPMLTWAAIVVATLFVASMPMFLGLVVVLPVLGHTTWHLYRKLVEPEQPAG